MKNRVNYPPSMGLDEQAYGGTAKAMKQLEELGFKFGETPVTLNFASSPESAVQAQLDRRGGGGLDFCRRIVEVDGRERYGFAEPLQGPAIIEFD